MAPTHGCPSRTRLPAAPSPAPDLLVPIEHELRLLGNLPEPHGAVPSPRCHAALPAQAVQPCDDVLVPVPGGGHGKELWQARPSAASPPPGPPVHPMAAGSVGSPPGSYRVSTYAFSATFQTLTQRSWEALYSWCVPFRKDRPCGQIDGHSSEGRRGGRGCLALQASQPMPLTHRDGVAVPGEDVQALAGGCIPDHDQLVPVSRGLADSRGCLRPAPRGPTVHSSLRSHPMCFRGFQGPILGSGGGRGCFDPARYIWA